MDNELTSLLKRIKEAEGKAFYGLKGMSELYIKNKEKDINKIEILLYELIEASMYLEEAEPYFFRLCDYLETMDKEIANDYRKIFKEEYEDELEKEGPILRR